MKRLLAGGLVAVIVLTLVYLFVGRERGDRVRGLTPAGDSPFGERDHLDGAIRGLFSDTGSRLAVLTADGLGLAQQGKILPITRAGSNVVDAAWFANAATLLVAEGPVPTGALVVIDVDGEVRGTIPLEPSVGFGSGYGMTVAPGGRQAVVTAVERPALGPEQRRLVVVDLETGATRDLTTPGGADEQRPFYVDRGRVAFTEVGADVPPRAMIADVGTGSVEEISAAASVVGTIGEEPVLQDLRARLFLVSSRDRALVTVPEGTRLTSIDPAQMVAVVAETVATADGSRTGRLRRVRLKVAPPG